MAISTAGAIGGSIISGLFGRSSAKRQMNFQERLANTAFQRQTVDLEAAGLNRILGMSGSGASAPGGAMPSTPDFASSAVAAAKVKAEIDLIDANTELVKTKTGVVTPVGKIGELGGTVIDAGVSTAKDLQRWLQKQVDDFYQRNSGITGKDRKGKYDRIRKKPLTIIVTPNRKN